jgi:hypothetical protein
VIPREVENIILFSTLASYSPSHNQQVSTTQQRFSVGRLYGISFLQHLTILIPSISSAPILPWCGGLLLLLLATLIKLANRLPCHVSSYICWFIHIPSRLIYLFLSPPPCQIRMSLKFVMLATQTGRAEHYICVKFTPPQRAEHHICALPQNSALEWLSILHE